MSNEISFLNTLRDLQLNGNVGVVLSDQESRFRLGRGSDVLSKQSKKEAAAILLKMGQRLASPTKSNLLLGCDTILKGNPKVEALKNKIEQGVSHLLPPERRKVQRKEYNRAIRIITAEYKKALKQSLEVARKNLAVLDSYSQRIGGRKGGVEFIEGLIEANPGDFYIDFETHEKASQMYNKILRDYLIEKFPDKAPLVQQMEDGAAIKKMTDLLNKLTLRDAKELNERFSIAFAAAGLQYRMPYESAVEEQYLESAAQKGPIDALVTYRAKLAAKIFPLLEGLYFEGKIAQGVPLCLDLVQAGNNDIRNNMQLSIVTKLVHEFLESKGLGDQKIPVYIISFGGHPTTAAFVAHVEVMSIAEKCEFLKKEGATKGKMILESLQSAVQKLPGSARETALSILASNRSIQQKLDELHQNDSTRDIFKFVGFKNAGLKIVDPEGKTPYIALFNGVGEAPTHADLMKRINTENPEELNEMMTLTLEAHSTNTGENIENFVGLIPPGSTRIRGFFDAFRMGRQVKTATCQMMGSKSGFEERNWDAVFATLIDLPIAHYKHAYTNDQLMVECAGMGAELMRNLLYPITGFIDPTPLDPANFDLAASYYAKMVGVSLADAENTPICLVQQQAGREFAQLENSIRPGHDQDLHSKIVSEYYLKQQARKMLQRESDPEFEETISKTIQGIHNKAVKPKLKFPLKSLPKRILELIK